MKCLALIINIFFGLFGVTALWWSETISQNVRIIFTVVLFILVVLKSIIDHMQSQRQSKLEEQAQARIIGNVQTLTSKLQEETTQAEKLAELENRPDIRLETEAIRFDTDKQSFVFPVRNYGRTVAERVTLKFDSDQLLNHSEQRMEDLPPDGLPREFVVTAFLPVRPNSEIWERYKQLVADIQADREALVFSVSGFYLWNGKEYEIGKRYGILNRNGLLITLSKGMSFSSDKDRKLTTEQKDAGDRQ